jgi:hypothetical protein
MKKSLVLFLAATFIATFALIGCNKSQEPPQEAATPAPEQGAPGTPAAVPAPPAEMPGAPASLPPPISFQGPPDVIAMPDTGDVYAAPDIDADLFFWNGSWWRLWQGRWYSSRYYDRGWGYYNAVPSFYFDIDPGWRGYYRDHNWNGHRWNYERIPPQQLQQNWKSWHNNRHWEKQGTWGVQNYQPRPQQQRQALRQQRQQQYQQRPEVQQHQQQKQPQVQKPQVQKPQTQQPQGKVQQPQKQEQKPQAQKPQVQEQKQRQAQKPQAQEQKQPQAQKPQVQKPQTQQPQGKVQQPQKQEQKPQAQKPHVQKKPEGAEREHEK